MPFTWQSGLDWGEKDPKEMFCFKDVLNIARESPTSQIAGPEINDP